MKITVQVHGLDRLLTRWRYIAHTGLRKELQEVATEFAPQLLEAIRQNAPVRTGGYRSRLYAEVHGYRIVVGSPDPFARRLEEGFIGVDSLGRHYAQPPQPHFRPAMDALSPEYAMRLAQIVKEKAK